MTVTIPPQGWPAGRPLAISVSIMLEGWAEGSAPGIGPARQDGDPPDPGGLTPLELGVPLPQPPCQRGLPRKPVGRPFRCALPRPGIL